MQAAVDRVDICPAGLPAAPQADRLYFWPTTGKQPLKAKKKEKS